MTISEGMKMILFSTYRVINSPHENTHQRLISPEEFHLLLDRLHLQLLSFRASHGYKTRQATGGKDIINDNTVGPRTKSLVVQQEKKQPRSGESVIVVWLNHLQP